MKYDIRQIRPLHRTTSKVEHNTRGALSETKQIKLFIHISSKDIEWERVYDVSCCDFIPSQQYVLKSVLTVTSLSALLLY